MALEYDSARLVVGSRFGLLDDLSFDRDGRAFGTGVPIVIDHLGIFGCADWWGKNGTETKR